MFRHCLDLTKKNVKKNCDYKTIELFREIPYTGWLVLYMWLAEIPLYQRLVMPQPLFKEMESHCQDCWNVRISVWRNFSAKPKNGPIWLTWRKTSETRFYFWNAVLEYLVWFTKNSSQFSYVCLRTQPMTHQGWKLPGKQSKIFFHDILLMLLQSERCLTIIEHGTKAVQFKSVKLSLWVLIRKLKK